MNTELKNCPFCGGDADIFIYAEKDEVLVKVECGYCGVHRAMRQPKDQSLTEFNKLVDATVEYWNDRKQVGKPSSTVLVDLESSTIIDYRSFDDCVVIHTEQGPVTVRREWLKNTTKRVDELYEDSQKWDWIETENGFRCDNCNAESRYAFQRCSNCGQKMKNGIERF